MNNKLKLSFLLGLAFTALTFAQDEEEKKSNVQTFTPSKLLSKGQWDIKSFNSVYTQTKRTDENSEKVDVPRESFFTSTNEIYTGVSDNSRVNVGLIFQVRSNTIADRSTFSVLKFEDNRVDARSGLTTIAPSIRIQPLKNVGNFSFTTSLYIPVFKDLATNDDNSVGTVLYLDQRSFTWETRFFFDHTFGGGKWQVFTEANFRYNFGESGSDADPATENVRERFANNSLFLPVGAFLSYFPSSKSTVFINAQQLSLFEINNEFSQEGTALGFGGKYQITQKLNIEASYSNIVRGSSFQGLGNTFGLGLRYLL